MGGFKYYYGNDAENFNFFRLPKKLIRDKQFCSLSSDAKILYGILLDRMTLSAKNGWLDEYSRIYIIFTIEEIAEELSCSRRKSIQLMNELDGIGLIERRRRGMGRPNLIYVKNFNVDEDRISRTSASPTGHTSQERPGENIIKERKDSKGIRAVSQEVQKHALQEVQECAPQEVQKRTPQEVQKRTPQEVQKCAPQEVQKCAPQNDTDRNDTEYIYNNPSIHLSGYAKEGWRDRALVDHILRKKTGYEQLVHDSPGDTEQINEMIGLMTDVCCYGQDTLNINGLSVPSEDVRHRLMSLNIEHIRYVLGCLKKNVSKIKNIRSYMLTCLYNAPVTAKSYYQSEVEYDMRTGNE